MTENALQREPIAPPDKEAHPTRPRRLSSWAALVWSLVTLGLATCWLTGVLPSPFAEPRLVYVGALLNAFDATVGELFTLALGLLGVVCAVLALRRRLPGRGGRLVLGMAWGIAACTLLVLVHGQLLALLGYAIMLPIVGWLVPGLADQFLTNMLDPGLFLVDVVVGGLVWGTTALAYGRRLRNACPACGRGSDWTAEREQWGRARAVRLGRIGVVVACVAALAYPAVRVPWLFGIGVDGLETGDLMVGAGLSGAALLCLVPMLGLVSNWGVRTPRWLGPLAGRRVPIPVVVVPAAVVVVAVAAIGRTLLALMFVDTTALDQGIGLGAIVLVAAWPWAAGLAMATVAYAVRRRGPCTPCGRGLTETSPRG